MKLKSLSLLISAIFTTLIAFLLMKGAGNLSVASCLGVVFLTASPSFIASLFISKEFWARTTFFLQAVYCALALSIYFDLHDFLASDSLSFIALIAMPVVFLMIICAATGAVGIFSLLWSLLKRVKNDKRSSPA